MKEEKGEGGFWSERNRSIASKEYFKFLHFQSLLVFRGVHYREPETQQNARPFGSSMAKRQRFVLAVQTVNKPCLCGPLLSTMFCLKQWQGFPIFVFLVYSNVFVFLFLIDKYWSVLLSYSFSLIKMRQAVAIFSLLVISTSAYPQVFQTYYYRYTFKIEIRCGNHFLAALKHFRHSQIKQKSF